MRNAVSDMADAAAAGLAPPAAAAGDTLEMADTALTEKTAVYVETSSSETIRLLGLLKCVNNCVSFICKIVIKCSMFIITGPHYRPAGWLSS